MERVSQQPESRWPRRLAIALALVTFPLICVGGLVTTYDAGMAVPDWPGTYGYNLFRYPWQSWLAGPWDLFIEHGHRLLGAMAGMLSVALVAVVCLTDRRKWLVIASVGALALVIFQGVLGGARVLFDERMVALVHGCVGPLFFAYLAGLCLVTSPRWLAAPRIESLAITRFHRAAWITVGLAYFQLVIGAVLRHVPLAASPGVFRAALILHLFVAAALAGHVLAAPFRARKLSREAGGLKTISGLLAALVFVQVFVGFATYVAKYAFPAWLGDYAFAAAYVVAEKGFTQSLITTAHMANGSLILFTSVVAALQALRISGNGQAFILSAGASRGDEKLLACRYGGRAAA